MDSFPPHTCQLGPEGPCRACELLDQSRWEPTEEQINDWNIHNDHAQGNQEPEEYEEEPF
jgi:hypothetical protein